MRSSSWGTRSKPAAPPHDPAAAAAAHRDLGAAHLRLGHHDSARTHYDASLELARAHGDPLEVAGTLNNIGNLEERLGDYRAAAQAYQRGLAITREIGFRLGEATLLINLSVAERQQGNYAESLNHCLAGAAVFDELNDVGGGARARVNLAEIQLRLGRPELAIGEASTALDRAGTIGATNIAVEALNTLACAQLAHGQRDDALDAHDRALVMAIATSDSFEQARAHEGRGRALAELGRTEEAEKELQLAVRAFSDLGVPDVRGATEGLEALGRPELSRTQPMP